MNGFAAAFNARERLEGEAIVNEIKCGSIWGGISNLDEDIAAGGIRASVYSRASRSHQGGDLYYFSVCGGDLLARVAVADVVGHGASVADVSGWLYDALADRIDDIEGSKVLEELNNRSVEYGARAMATAAVVAYYRPDGRVYFSYAGHPPLLVRRAETGRWVAAEIEHPSPGIANLPLAVFENAHYDQGSLPVQPGDRMLLVTDGILEARDASGKTFGTKRLLETLNSIEGGTTNDVIDNAITAAKKHSGADLEHDDVTLVAFEVV